ncbi:MAG: ABC transporter ATP-binding protein [Planctomycetota bacterium]
MPGETPPHLRGHPPIIRVTNVRLAYGDTIVLDHITFDVFPGEVFVILGGSGCGKSTLLKHIIRLYRAAAGSVLIDGEDIVPAEGALLERILRRFGVMYQSGALFGSMTLLENVRLPLEEFTTLPPDAMTLIARTRLSLVGLEPYRNYYPSEISGGMQKRAAIARAMALDPRILFLDEPSAGLDPVTSAELDDLIIKLSRNLGITFVIVTHELPSIMAIADRAIMLDKQTRGMLAVGTPRELAAHKAAAVSHFFSPRREGAGQPPHTRSRPADARKSGDRR